MRGLMLVAAGSVFAALLPAGVVLGSPTGLLLIPTADTIGAGRYQLQLEVDGSLSPSPFQYWLLDTEAGVASNVELGVDVNLLMRPQPRVFTNWKYAFAPVGRGRVGAAFGMGNWNEQPLTGPYALSTADLGRVRITSGVTYLFRAYRFMAGIDTGFRRKLTWMADYVSGPDLFLSAGFSYEIGPDYQLLAGLVFPNSGGGTLFTVQFAWGGKFAQPPR